MTVPAPETKPKARATFRDDGMNGTERAYANHLELQRRVKRILWWEYEAIKLKLADGTWYTCDFFVVAADGTFEAHEVKGHMREAARVRINVATDKFPFVFKLVKLVNQQWEITTL